MKVHYGEGVAIRIGPEPCAGTREGDGEASIGENRGVRTANGFVATLALVSLCGGQRSGSCSPEPTTGLSWVEVRVVGPRNAKGLVPDKP